MNQFEIEFMYERLCPVSAKTLQLGMTLFKEIHAIQRALLTDERDRKVGSCNQLQWTHRLNVVTMRDPVHSSPSQLGNSSQTSL